MEANFREHGGFRTFVQTWQMQERIETWPTLEHKLVNMALNCHLVIETSPLGHQEHVPCFTSTHCV